MSENEFDRIVESAIESVPESLRAYVDETEIIVTDYPGPEAPEPDVLGLYVGVPRTEHDDGGPELPGAIYIYKRSHELEFLSDEELREEVRKTVIHEIAHHFGLDEHEMGDYA